MGTSSKVLPVFKKGGGKTEHNGTWLTTYLLTVGTWTEAQCNLAGQGFRRFLAHTSWPMLGMLVLALAITLALVFCMRILPLRGLEICHLIDDLLKDVSIYGPRTLGDVCFPIGQQLALAMQCFGLIKQRLSVWHGSTCPFFGGR